MTEGLAALHAVEIKKIRSSPLYKEGPESHTVSRKIQGDNTGQAQEAFHIIDICLP